MFHLLDEADLKGDTLATSGLNFLKHAHSRNGRIVLRLQEKRGEAVSALSKIWLDYQTERSLEPNALENRIKKARVASDNLETALKALKRVPKLTIAQFQGFKPNSSVGEFDQAMEVIVRMKWYADGFVRDLKSGRPSDEVITRTAHRLARLYSSLCDRPFPRSYSYISEKEFASPGTEFVRRILNEIDSMVEPKEVATALKKFWSSEK
ncbi:hypothetical protein E0H65_14080 [Rhizobium leguminosarum bv. viciae]|nr:hypothetical protein E0H65_14080 [Rhizobium leguminosarum bv. viciae]